MQYSIFSYLKFMMVTITFYSMDSSHEWDKIVQVQGQYL